MKKITLLQSAFALIAAFMLALPARAQVASAADLFGTYKFTADVNVTDAGQALKDNFKSECEVIITKCSQNIYDGEIQGLAGAANAQKIYSVDTEKNVIIIRNPNSPAPWGGGLYMANAEGGYPFAQDNQYSDIEYAFDPTTKTITLPNFTLVTCDHANSAATIAASFTNVKMTLVQSESIEVTDLSGDWHFTAGKGTYDVMEGSTLPTEWDMTLTATDDTKKAYNISLTLGDFAPLALTAIFDGVTLNVPFKDTYFDVENKIGLVYYGGNQGNISFSLANENLLTLTSGMYIAQDSISPEVKGGTLQYYIAGSAKRQGGESAAFDWAGTFKVKAEQVYPVNTAYEYPAEFDMVVAYWEVIDAYYVSEFMGYTLPNGGFQLIPDENDPTKATFAAGTRFLTAIEAGVTYLTLGDINATESAINLTIKEDGTVSIADFCVNLYDYATKTGTPAGSYMGVTAEKAPAAEPFTWAQTFTVKGDVTAYDGNTYPESFEMEVQYFENWGMYLVTKFFGNDVTALNNGGILFNISEEDPTKAEMNTGGLIGTVEAGVTYYKLFDMNAQTSPLTLTLNEDETVSISNFCVSTINWNTGDTKAVALYENVVATIGTTVEPEPEPEPFNWAGTFTVSAESISVYNETYTYPNDFEMEIQYFEDWGMYLVTKFLGNDVTVLNYGGIMFTPSTEDSNKAEMATGGIVGTIEAGVTYFQLLDMNATTSPITLTANEDGTISINNFCVSVMDWNTKEAKAAALYNNVTAVTGFDAIENIEAAPALKAWSANGTIYVAGEAQAVEVYDMSGRTVFNGVASQVGGLNKGLYLVKVKNAVAKVAVK